MLLSQANSQAPSYPVAMKYTHLHTQHDEGQPGDSDREGSMTLSSQSVQLLIQSHQLRVQLVPYKVPYNHSCFVDREVK